MERFTCPKGRLAVNAPRPAPVWQFAVFNPRLAEGVARTINREIPASAKVLVIHFAKKGFVPDIPKLIKELLLPRPGNVDFLNWGRHTATNDFHDYGYVVLAGILQYSVPINEAKGRGAKRLTVDEDLPEDDFNRVRYGEIAHNIRQAANRGHLRQTVNGNCPPGCHVYAVFSTREGTGIPADIIKLVFEGIHDEDIVPWNPIPELRGKYQKAVAKLLEHHTGAITFEKADLAEKLGGRTDNIVDAIDKEEFRTWLRENKRLDMNINRTTVEFVRGLPF